MVMSNVFFHWDFILLYYTIFIYYFLRFSDKVELRILDFFPNVNVNKFANLSNFYLKNEKSPKIYFKNVVTNTLVHRSCSWNVWSIIGNDIVATSTCVLLVLLRCQCYYIAIVIKMLLFLECYYCSKRFIVCCVINCWTLLLWAYMMEEKFQN